MQNFKKVKALITKLEKKQKELDKLKNKVKKLEDEIKYIESELAKELKTTTSSNFQSI